MSDCPILFSGPMVRAILEGRKTQTRRVVKLPDDITEGPKYWAPPSGRSQPGYADPGVNYWTESGNHIDPCPYGQPGDRLWVRENFQPLYADGFFYEDVDWKTGHGYDVKYMATDPREDYLDHNTEEITDRVTPSIHMPKWAARIWLEVVSVRVERLQDISEEDAKAEGIEYQDGGKEITQGWLSHDRSVLFDTALLGFANLWDSLNAKRGYGWDDNPWVWAVEFRRLPADSRREKHDG